MILSHANALNLDPFKVVLQILVWTYLSENNFQNFVENDKISVRIIGEREREREEVSELASERSNERERQWECERERERGGRDRGRELTRERERERTKTNRETETKSLAVLVFFQEKALNSVKKVKGISVPYLAFLMTALSKFYWNRLGLLLT